MAEKPRPVPEGYHTATPYLVIKNAAAAIDFYAKAFGAVERYRMPGPGGAIMHAELQLGDSVIMLCDENPDWCQKSPLTLGGTPLSVFLYVPDVDATFSQAVAAGATTMMPPADMFWGDRMAKVSDPFGHEWGMASHVEDVSQEEMARRMAAMPAGPA